MGYRIVLILLLVCSNAANAQQDDRHLITVRNLSKVLWQATHGDANAQTRVGFAYERGIVVKQDSSEAARWFSLAASRSAIAEYNLGVLKFYGRGVQQNRDEALALFERAAVAGLAEAQFNAAVLYQHGTVGPQNFGRALDLYHEAARAGFARAQTNLGQMYLEGEGVHEDDALGAYWSAQAAKRGDAVGEFNLALLYLRGKGVPRDRAKAAKWFQLSAEQGHSGAQTNLCSLYKDGRGLLHDLEAAYVWCSLSLNHGDNPTQVGKLKELSAAMSPTELESAERKVLEWLARHKSTQAEDSAHNTDAIKIITQHKP